MSTSSLAAPGGMNAVKRAVLFVLAAAIGILVGIAWNGSSLPTSAYLGFLKLFLDPSAQIAGLAAAVVLAFLLGFIHLVYT